MVVWFRCPGFREFHAFEGNLKSHGRLSLCDRVPFHPVDSFRDCVLDFDKACRKCLEVIESR